MIVLLVGNVRENKKRVRGCLLIENNILINKKIVSAELSTLNLVTLHK